MLKAAAATVRVHVQPHVKVAVRENVPRVVHLPHIVVHALAPVQGLALVHAQVLAGVHAQVIARVPVKVDVHLCIGDKI